MQKKPEREDLKKRMPENVVDLTDLLREKRLQREREAREALEREQSAKMPDPDDFDENNYDEYDFDNFDYDEYDFDENAYEEIEEKPRRTENSKKTSENRRNERTDRPRREEEIPEEDEEDERPERPRKKPARKPVSVGARILDVLIVTFLFLLVLLAAAMIAASLTPAENIIISGNEYTEEARIREYYFPDEKSLLMSRIIVKTVTGRTNPPAFSSAKYKLTGLKECTLELVEKEALFTIISAEDAGYLVITSDGAELTTLPETPEHLTFISGIAAEKSSPLFRPETDNPELYDALIQAVLEMRKNEVEPEELYILKNSIFLRFGAVKVCLGDGENLDGKLSVLKDQVPLFHGLKGTLHLEDYTSAKENERFRFEVEP